MIHQKVTAQETAITPAERPVEREAEGDGGGGWGEKKGLFLAVE